MKIFRVLVLAGVIVGAIGLSGIWVAARNSKITPTQTQKARAIEHALAFARQRGLQSVDENGVAAKLTTQQEWFDLTLFSPSQDAAQFGLDPNRSIWIVAFKGPVDWTGPGRVGRGQDRFDNMALALTADTFEHLATLSVSPDTPLPLGLKR